MMGNEQLICGMWVYFTLERAKVRKIPAEASREKQEGIQGQWQQESSFREVLEHVQGNADMGGDSQTMRQCYLAMRNGSWEEFKERYRTFGHCGGNSEEGHGLLAAGHCASRWNGRSHLFVCLPVFKQFSVGGLHRRDTETATTERRSIAVGGVRNVEAHTNGERPTGYWLCSSVPMPMKQRCSKRTRRHKGNVTDNLINALKLLSNLQRDGDSPIQSNVTGLHERSRKGIMDGPRHQPTTPQNHSQTSHKEHPKDHTKNSHNSPNPPLD